ncbi:MAG: hypothetical protein U0T80_03680 [Flavobacteriaceae bacterium]
MNKSLIIFTTLHKDSKISNIINNAIKKVFPINESSLIIFTWDNTSIDSASKYSETDLIL